VLKIQRSGNGRVVFTLSGRIETEDVEDAATTARFGDSETAVGLGFEERDARQPGRGDISHQLRGGQHNDRKLPCLYTRVDRARKKSNKAPANSMKGLEVARLETCGLE
jgi:hypothetical protein